MEDNSERQTSFTERFLNDFVYADSRLGSHPIITATTFWREGRELVGADVAPPHQARGKRLRLDDDSLASKSFRKQKIIIVDDFIVYGIPAGWNMSNQQWGVAGRSPRSALVVPLIDSNQSVGVLAMDCTEPFFFSFEPHFRLVYLLGVLLVYLHWHIDDRISTPASRALGHALRQVRQSLGKNQGQLGEQLGVGRIAVSRFESGSQPPTKNSLYQWCSALRLVTATTSARVELVELTPQIQKLLETDPRKMAALSPTQFEIFISERLDRMGYDVTLTGATTLKDGGIDLVAVPKIRTVGAFMLAVQAKHHEKGNKTGRVAVDRLLSWKDAPFRLGLLVTNTEFTKDALWVAGLERNRTFLRLRDFNDLKRWLSNDFTSEYNWREIPDTIELAPGVVVRIPRPKVHQPELFSRAAPTTLNRE